MTLMKQRSTSASGAGRVPLSVAVLSLLIIWVMPIGCEVHTRVSGLYLGEAPPGRTPKIFASGLISGASRLHGTPVFSPDGSEVYWSAVDPHSGGVRVLFMKNATGTWSAPAVAPFSNNHQNDVPFFAADGETLYFVSDRPTAGQGETDKQNIWLVGRIPGGWSDPRPVGAAVNSTPLHWQVSVTADGTLYFASDGAGDIYRAMLRDGEYSRPVRLGGAVNTEVTECCPFVSSDGALLLFARSTPGHGADLFASFRTPTGAWTPAVNLGRDVNTDAHDLCPIVSPDGEYLFFLSERDGRSGAYWVSMEVVDALRPGD